MCVFVNLPLTFCQQASLRLMEIIFSIMKNEVKEIKLPETKKLAMELVGC